MSRFDVKNKVTLITGAAGGIGMALARGFWEAGAIVLPVTRRQDTDWGRTFRGSDSRWQPLLCDLAQPGAAQTLADLALAAGKGWVDVLINNAAICPATPDNVYDEELRSQVHRIAFEAPYALCGLIAPLMAKQGGGVHNQCHQHER